jgi:hypothetical protein
MTNKYTFTNIERHAITMVYADNIWDAIEEIEDVLSDTTGFDLTEMEFNTNKLEC